MWAWGLETLANCTAARNRQNTVIKVRLCSYSLAETAAVTAETGITWDRSQSGALYLYRDPDHFRTGRANFKLLADEGVEARTLEREELANFEPALAAVKDRFAGAIHTPHDQIGRHAQVHSGTRQVLPPARRRLQARRDGDADRRATATASPESRPTGAGSRAMPMSWRSAATVRC